MNPAELAAAGSTGVSLHCHTMHSKEMLDFIPFYAEKLPIVSYMYSKEKESFKHREGRGIDFTSAYWQPPMTPQTVYDSERQKLNDAGLRALISITDHDEINGNFEITDERCEEIPISLEWTVPFDIGFFHFGVHNLPRDQAGAITADLLEYTFKSETNSIENLNALFERLNDLPGVLLVFNHPLWDIELIGAEQHAILLERFIATHGRWVHALEVNGFRNWSENKATIELAENLGLPVVSGGDRHGCRHNTVINVSRCTTFEEFVSEVRIDGRSQVALLPEYERPLHHRQMQSFAEILGYYPEFAEERRRWFDRIFFDMKDGKGVVPLSAHGWKKGGPVWLRMAIKVMGGLGSPAMLPIFRMLRKSEDRVPRIIDKALADKSPAVRTKLTSEAA